MDLLAGYGSDDSQGEGSPSASPVREPSPVRTAVAAPKAAFSLPAPRAAGSALPADFFDASAHSSLGGQAEGPSSSFNAAPGEADEPVVGPEKPLPSSLRADAQDLPQPSGSKLWTKLPAPQPSRKRVVFRPAIDPSALASSDSEGEDAAPDAKRAKPSGRGASSILSFLPAPKHAPAGGSSNGAPRGSKPSSSNSFQQAQQGRAAAAAAAAAGGGGGASAAPAHGNEAYRVRAAGPALNPAPPAAAAAAAGYYSEEGVLDPAEWQPAAAAAGGGVGVVDGGGSDAAAAAASYYQAGPSAAGAGQQHQQQQQQQYYEYYYQQEHYSDAVTGTAAAAAGGALAPQEPDLIEAALQEERAKAARRGGAAAAASSVPVVKQINADKLKYVDPSVREAQAGMQAVLGTDYALSLRSEAAPFAGNKMAKRKHQIGTLFHNARMNELKLMEQKAAGIKSKAETAGKYGW